MGDASMLHFLYMLHKSQTYFFFALFGVVAVLVGLLFVPFANALALSLILSVVLWAPFERLSKLLGGWRGLAALVVIVAALTAICVPLYFFSVRVAAEAKSLYTYLGDANVNIAMAETLLEKPLHRVLPSVEVNLKPAFDKSLDFFVANAANIFGGAAVIVFNLLLVLVTAFFCLKDGPQLKNAVLGVSLLPKDYNEEIAGRLYSMTNAVVRGVLLVAVIQGILVGIGLAVFGFQNATLWGTVAGIASLIPGLGTGVVFIPAVLFLFATATLGKALGLFAWAAVVSVTDNVLRPYFYSKGVPIHPLLMLFSVLGGISVFGPLGFLYGPILMGLFATLAIMHARMTEAGDLHA